MKSYRKNHFLRHRLLLLLLLLGCCCRVVETLSECFPMDLKQCPGEECDCCHYFKVNYVTNCSESDLTEIPPPYLNVYVLNIKGGFETKTPPLPPSLFLFLSLPPFSFFLQKKKSY